MKRKLFDKTLDFEINVIGYKNKGESIVFFLKTDGKVVYAGLVDCYEEQSENVAISLLQAEGLECFDFVCWTHPHDDHTIGMDKIITDFCDDKTLFWIPPFILDDIEEYSSAAQKAYENLFQILKSGKRNKMEIRKASDSKTLEKIICYGNASVNPYVFEIKCFAPDTNLLTTLQVKERLDTGNIYSIGLLVNIGHFYIILAGDVENRTFKFIPDFNLDIGERVDYIKIPHHASSSGSYLIDRFSDVGIAAPSVATTTLYRIHNLPDKEVLRKYNVWGRDTEIYSTGCIENEELNEEKHGIVKTTFDVLEQRDIPIETSLLGNAVPVNVAV